MILPRLLMLIALLALAGPDPTGAEGHIEIAAIAASPDDYHLRQVTLQGRVHQVRQLDPYFQPSGTACSGAYVFTLEDETGYLPIAVLGIYFTVPDTELMRLGQEIMGEPDEERWVRRYWDYGMDWKPREERSYLGTYTMGIGDPGTLYPGRCPGPPVGADRGRRADAHASGDPAHAAAGVLDAGLGVHLDEGDARALSDQLASPPGPDHRAAVRGGRRRIVRVEHLLHEAVPEVLRVPQRRRRRKPVRPSRHRGRPPCW